MTDTWRHADGSVRVDHMDCRPGDYFGPLKLTEGHVLGLLRQRHAKWGNGGSGEYAFATHVRNGAGFDATRTFDAVAINLWPSKGLAVEIFEVKVSRSDWLRELKQPEKSQAALDLADYFTVVAPVGCVKVEELPEGWGLLEVTANGNGLRRKRAPRRLTPPPRTFHPEFPSRTVPNHRDLPRGFVIGLLKAIPGAVPTP